MIFYLHYILLTSGLSGTSVLLAVYFKSYSDASQGETGALLMAIPFLSLFIRPIFCSMADRRQAHHLFLMLALVVMMIGFAPFVVVPFFPQFYAQHPRHAWYFLAGSCLLGASGLSVAWSLGDCLAVNHAQRSGVPFGRMRLMGTLSWGVYGFIIGQINENPALPKYVPAFVILHLSVAMELLLLALWDKRAFEMEVDLLGAGRRELSSARPRLDSSKLAPIDEQKLAANSAPGLTIGSATREQFASEQQASGEMDSVRQRRKQIDNLVDSVPSSLGGTLKLKPQTAKALFEVLGIKNDADELSRRLREVEKQAAAAAHEQDADQDESRRASRATTATSQAGECRLEVPNQRRPSTGSRNPQLILLKLILSEDGRVIKYIILFTIFGAFIAPITFFFVSIENLCHERGYNFSQLAGAVLMSQALIETVAFLVVPNLLHHMSRWSLLSAGLVIMALKYVFYAGWYYDQEVSPYWAVLSEWSHGIPYGIFCTIMADVSLMFANESRLFIPELRRLGYLAQEEPARREERDEEERSIKLALRATMQALFGGFMDGLGLGAGSLLCGLFSDLYSYHTVWQIFAALTIGTFLVHLLIELTRSRFSDNFRPAKGTKAYEIMELSRATEMVLGAKAPALATAEPKAKVREDAPPAM